MLQKPFKLIHSHTFDFPDESIDSCNERNLYNSASHLQMSPEGCFLLGIKSGTHNSAFEPDHRVPYKIAEIYILDLKNGKVVFKNTKDNDMSEGRPSIITLSSDANKLAYAVGMFKPTQIYWIRIFPPKPEPWQSLVIDSGYITALKFSPNGQLLASVDSKHNIKLWDLDTNSLLTSLTSHPSSITALAFSPSGQLLASGDSENNIKLWNIETNTLITTLTGHPGSITALAFSSSGQLLASGDSENNIKLWNIETNTLITTLTGHSGSITALAFSPDSEVLTSSSNKMILFWNLSTGQILETLEEEGLLSQDGQTLAIIKRIPRNSAKEYIDVWHVES